MKKATLSTASNFPSRGPMPDLFEFQVKEPGLYKLDVLTAAQWASLTADEGPADYTQLHPDCFVKFYRDRPKS